MKRLILIALLGFTVLPMAAHAQFLSWCQLSYRFDSFGQGIASVFKGTYVSSRWSDVGCFKLGQKEAQETIDREGSRFVCDSEFKDGFEKGLEASPSSAGVPCFHMGYVAGISTLGTGARDGLSEVAGARCVSAYNKGKEAARNRAPSNPDSTDQPEYYCYQLGFSDSQLFP